VRKAACACVLLIVASATAVVSQPADPTADLLRFHPELAPALAALRFLGKPLTFLGILLFIGLAIGRLLDMAIAPAAAHPEAGFARDERTTRRVMVGRIVVWTIALAAASEVIGWRWFGAVVEPFGRLLATVVTAAAIVFAVAAFALGFAGHSRDTLLSALGWYYLNHHPSRPDRATPIDLGGGVTGRISKVDLLHTTFDLGGGRVEIRPNAWLMETHFGWGRAPEERRPSEPDPSS
jgi:hypothetical protein